jgi:hypothetical protein
MNYKNLQEHADEITNEPFLLPWEPETERASTVLLCQMGTSVPGHRFGF